jgi:hypothetical protein
MIADMVKKGFARPELTLRGTTSLRSAAEIMSQPDQTTEHAARLYCRNAARCRMADMTQDRIDNVIQLQARKPPRTNRAECDANRLCLQREFAK